MSAMLDDEAYQKLLSDLARTDPEKEVRWATMMELDDQHLLADIPMCDIG